MAQEFTGTEIFENLVVHNLISSPKFKNSLFDLFVEYENFILLKIVSKTLQIQLRIQSLGGKTIYFVNCTAAYGCATKFSIFLFQMYSRDNKEVCID